MRTPYVIDNDFQRSVVRRVFVGLQLCDVFDQRCFSSHRLIRLESIQPASAPTMHMHRHGRIIMKRTTAVPISSVTLILVITTQHGWIALFYFCSSRMFSLLGERIDAPSLSIHAYSTDACIDRPTLNLFVAVWALVPFLTPPFVVIVFIFHDYIAIPTIYYYLVHLRPQGCLYELWSMMRTAVTKIKKMMIPTMLTSRKDNGDPAPDGSLLPGCG